MNMSKTVKIAVATIGMAAAANSIMAADTPELVKTEATTIEFAISMDVMSCYASRGQINTDHAVMQPAVLASSRGFAFEVWGNYNLAHSDEPSRDFSELDLTPSYNFCIAGIDFSTGIIDYEFPNTESPSTDEAFFKVAYPNAYLTPIAEVYWDFDEADGVYATGALEHNFEIAQNLNITSGFSTGWGSKHYNNYFFEVKKNALNDGNVYLCAIYSVYENFEVGANCFYTWLWDSDIKDGAKQIYADTDKFVYGLTANYNF
jgi:hypothetical protein